LENEMKILKLAAAAAIALSSLSLPAAPAAAQRGDRWHHDNGRHNGWRNNHRTRQVCNWVMRHHHRVRVCRTVRW
jgi:Spy/CpxP family protein refolding chaperone